MTKKERVDQLERIQKGLHISTEEAEEVLAYDEAIDRGEIADELTKDQREAVKKMTSTGQRKNTPTTRKTKEDPTKRQLISTVADLLHTLSNVSDIAISNPERIVSFTIAGDRYELTLTKKRK